jgi:hypothetical protein
MNSRLLTLHSHPIVNIDGVRAGKAIDPKSNPLQVELSIFHLTAVCELSVSQGQSAAVLSEVLV